MAVTLNANTSTGFIATSDTSGVLQLQTGGTTAVTVDTAQNVGVGVTPSAWGSSYKVLQLPGGNIGAFSTTAITTFQNAYDSGTGSYVYLTTAAASRYTQSQGQHQWFNAASGTAGNAITFTQAMTLDASGNLGIGTTSPVAKFQVAGTQTVTGGSAASSANGLHLWFNTGTNTAYIQGYQAGVDWRNIVYNGSSHIWQITDVEKARIDSSGNLLVGTTSGTSRINASASNNSVNTTYFAHTGNAAGVSVIDATNTSYASSVIALDCYTTAGTGWKFMACYSSAFASERLYIRGDGNVYNVNGTYGSISDVKLKENIVDATPKLANLMQVKIRNYNMIGDEQKQLGVVAQELEQIFPSMVDETVDYDRVVTTDEDGKEKVEQVAKGTTTKSVKYSVFIPMLIKAIQEQQAIIQTLTDRITALEGTTP